jgi:hypothetical protein
MSQEQNCGSWLEALSVLSQIRANEKIRLSRGVSARGGLCEYVCEFAFAGFDWNEERGGYGWGEGSCSEGI